MYNTHQKYGVIDRLEISISKETRKEETKREFLKRFMELKATPLPHMSSKHESK